MINLFLDNGFVSEPNAIKIAQERRKRYAELSVKDVIKIDIVEVSYARTTYFGEILDKDISPLDILILCDHGNTCFGGTVSIIGNNFTASVYTD